MPHAKEAIFKYKGLLEGGRGRWGEGEGGGGGGGRGRSLETTVWAAIHHKKRVSDIPVPSRDVAYQTLPIII